MLIFLLPKIMFPVFFLFYENVWLYFHRSQQTEKSNENKKKNKSYGFTNIKTSELETLKKNNLWTKSCFFVSDVINAHI